MTQNVSYQNLNPLALLERSAFVYPEKTAVVYKDQRYTYSQFADRVKRLANALREAGVGKGDKVAFLVPNLPAMLEVSRFVASPKRHISHQLRCAAYWIDSKRSR